MAGMDATVTRVTDGVAEPNYAFDVTTTGGSAVRGWPHTVEDLLRGGDDRRDASLGGVLWIIEDQIINGLGGAVALLISVIITAFFIPNMLRKGSIDLLISKPIGRSQLLVYKYIGGLTFIFLLSAFTIGGVWLVLGLRSGFWDPTFLVVIPVLTFTFAILYAVSTLVAVLTRSPIAAMLVSIGFMLFLYIVGQVKTIFDAIAERGPRRSDIAGVGVHAGGHAQQRPAAVQGPGQADQQADRRRHADPGRDADDRAGADRATRRGPARSACRWCSSR